MRRHCGRLCRESHCGQLCSLGVEVSFMSTVSIDKEPAGSARPAFITRIPTDDTLPRWRAWVTRHPIGGALLAGAVATQFATVFGIWFPGFGLPSVNWPVVNGQ